MSMAPLVVCPECGKKLRIPGGDARTKKVRCPSCRAIFRPESEVDMFEDVEAVALEEALRPGAPQTPVTPRKPAPTPERRRPEPARPKSRGRVLVWSLVALIALLGGGAFAVATWFPQYWPRALAPDDRPDAGAPNPPAPPVVADTGPWIQDFAAAQKRAVREKKDILVSFEGSDWCIWCQRMDMEIFSRPEFLQKAGEQFVLVKIDFPNDEPARSRVEDPARNQALSQRFGVTGYPFVVVTDAAGVPFGHINGFLEGGVTPYLADLEKLRDVRVRRDELLAKVDGAQGVDKLKAAQAALTFLKQCRLHENEKECLPRWLELAEKLDADNREGHLEFFFALDWLWRYQKATTDQLAQVMKDLERWKARHGEFKDLERRAHFCMELARGRTELQEYEAAFALLEEGLKLNPKDPITRQNLLAGPAALGLGTGTAFAVSAKGHFLTNAHVAGGPGRVFLRLPGSKKLQPARLVTEQVPTDLALVQLEDQTGTMPPPLAIASEHQPRRGEEVGAWGYPFGTALGGGLKLTKGVVSALPEAANNSRILLDLRVNPGSSGSPLCDAKGNVIGIVSARGPTPFGAQQTYGMAVSGADIVAFLRGNLPGFEAKAGAETLATWEEIDRRVSPSVAMIVKARPALKPPARPVP